MNIYIRSVLLIGAAALFGCQQGDRIAELENRQKESSEEIAKLREDLESLKIEASIDKAVRDFDKFAFLTPGGDGYSIVRFDLGYLTVQISDIKPYANGSKVKLKFGNPLSSGISGLKGTIEWGPVNEKGFPVNDNAKSKSFSFSTLLDSGSWTHVEIVLEGVPPAELGFVRLKELSHSGIRLLK